MRAASDRDLVVIQEMLAPPPVEDARSSLEFWERRRRSLPLYRVSARREAKVMAGRWQVREMEIRNRQEKTATRLQFDFGP